MALIDIRCSPCDRVSEAYRAAADWPATPPCPHCGGPTEQIHLPSYMKGHAVDPVVVYQAPDGTLRFPPDISSASTAMYEQLGYTRQEYRGAAEVRKFEHRFNQQQLSEINRRVERQQEAYERGESERRSEVRRGLEQGFRIPEYDDRGVATGRMETVRLTPRARAIMDLAMRKNDATGKPTARDAGFHVEAYSVDRSNREPDPRRRGQ